MEFLTLDTWGMVLALLMGFLFIFFGLATDTLFFFLTAMVTFLVLSAVVTYIGGRYKKKFKIGQEPRGAKNVLANGIPPLIMAIIVFATSSVGSGNMFNVHIGLAAIVGFIASVAGMTADKFSSEIGVLNGNPRMIFTWKKVRKGTSGGISGFGLVAGILGAFLISLLVFALSSGISIWPNIPIAVSLQSLHQFIIFPNTILLIIIITLSGFLGTIVDSMFGYYEEKGIGNKYTSNFFCGVAAGLIAMAMVLLI